MIIFGQIFSDCYKWNQFKACILVMANPDGPCLSEFGAFASKIWSFMLSLLGPFGTIDNLSEFGFEFWIQEEIFGPIWSNLADFWAFGPKIGHFLDWFVELNMKNDKAFLIPSSSDVNAHILWGFSSPSPSGVSYGLVNQVQKAKIVANLWASAPLLALPAGSIPSGDPSVFFNKKSLRGTNFLSLRGS